MKTSLKLASVLAVATLIAGCNTLRGLGEDLAAAGNALANTGKKEEPRATPAPATAAAPAPAPAPASTAGTPPPAPQQPTRR